jgi:hypothetical protein
MKKIIVILACCALIAPLASAKTPKKGTTADEAITVTGTVVQTTSEGGAVASYQPARTLVVNESFLNDPRRYVLEGSGHIVNTRGELVHTPIQPGTHVRVYFVNTGDSRAIDHVVVD